MKPVTPKSEVSDRVKDIPMPLVRQLRRHMNSLERSARNTTAWQNNRDRVIIEMMLDTGLRREEVCWVNVEDAREDLMPVIGKGDKKRRVPILTGLRRKLDAFLREKERRGEDVDDGAPLFVSRKGNRISIRQVNDIVSGRASDAGIGHHTPHALRHTFARNFLRRSEHPEGAVGDLGTLLGHSNLQTTFIYLKRTLPEIAASMERTA